MGRKGVKEHRLIHSNPSAAPQKKYNTAQHRELCLLGAKWLMRLPFSGVKYVSVELVTLGWELADVWGTTGFRSYLIEVKVSRSDFLRDAKKDVRINPKEGAGNFRYYLCPVGMVSPEEVPDTWGLLYEKDGKITLAKEAIEQEANNRAENAILCSIMRREGIKKQVFNYRLKTQQQ